MNFFEFNNLITNLVQKFPFKVLDIVIILNFLILFFEEIEYGITSSFSFLFSAAFSFFLGLGFYSWVSKIFLASFNMNKWFADSVSFFIIVILTFVVTYLMLGSIRKYKTVYGFNLLSVLGGFFLSLISVFFIWLFLTLFLLSYPSSKFIKDIIGTSFSGKFFSLRGQAIELNLKKMFGLPINETLNFVTIEQDNSYGIKLGFKVEKYDLDYDAEKKMAENVNYERKKYGLSILEVDNLLTDLAREHAKDMVLNDYFAHNDLDGYTPFDRLENGNAIFNSAAENLALAPDVEIAMQGLMTSRVHRENILSNRFRKMGIGVIDLDGYGKMFVQEFTD